MRNHRYKPGLYVVLISILVIASGCSIFLFRAQPSVNHMNLQYADSAKQALDLYLPNPKAEQDLPVILYVHGGGWTGGSRKDVEYKPAFFVQKGYAFVSVEHRFPPQVTYDKMVEDIALAVKWVHTHASQYRLDPNRINLMGHSSGGHLILLCGTNPDYLHRVGLSPSSLKSIVSLEGPLNLTYFVTRSKAYHGIFGESAKEWAAASPETYASAKNLPPILLVARRAGFVSAYAEKSRKAGNRVDVYETPTLTHNQVSGLIGSPEGSLDARNMANRIAEFLNQENF